MPTEGLEPPRFLHVESPVKGVLRPLRFTCCPQKARQVHRYTHVPRCRKFISINQLMMMTVRRGEGRNRTASLRDSNTQQTIWVCRRHVHDTLCLFPVSGFTNVSSHRQNFLSVPPDYPVQTGVDLWGMGSSLWLLAPYLALAVTLNSSFLL